MHKIYLVQFSCYFALASEVVFVKMPSRNQKKRSKHRAEYLQKQEENKAKPRALYKPILKRRPLYATATRPIPKRRRPL